MNLILISSISGDGDRSGPVPVLHSFSQGSRFQADEGKAALTTRMGHLNLKTSVI
jgi:hypothetical protein